MAMESDNIEWDCCFFMIVFPSSATIEKHVEALNEGDYGLWWTVSCCNCGEGSHRLNVNRGPTQATVYAYIFFYCKERCLFERISYYTLFLLEIKPNVSMMSGLVFYYEYVMFYFNCFSLITWLQYQSAPLDDTRHLLFTN